ARRAAAVARDEHEEGDGGAKIGGGVHRSEYRRSGATSASAPPGDRGPATREVPRAPRQGPGAAMNNVYGGDGPPAAAAIAGPAGRGRPRGGPRRRSGPR